MLTKLTERLGCREVSLGDLETDYRLACFREDFRAFALASALVVLPLIALAYHDFRFLDATPAAYALQAGRALVVAWDLLLLFKFRKNGDPSRFDLDVFCWITVGVLFAAVVRFTRPRDYLESFTLDVALIMILFLLLGIRRPLRTVPPVLYSATALGTLWFWKVTPATVGVGSITMAMLLATLGGYILTCRIENYRRETYLHRQRQDQLRRELEMTLSDLRQAQARVRSLTGLLPICSQCKRIRNQGGQWELLESYISGHSEAQFTHGLCADCMERLYPGFLGNLEENHS